MNLRDALVILGLLTAAVGVTVVVYSRGDNGDSGHAAAGRHHAAAPPPYATAPATRRVSIRFKHLPRSGLLFDLRTGRVLWSWQPNRRQPIASLAKMMTALVVAEHSRPSERVLITPTALRYQGSAVGVLPRNRRVGLEVLLYGLLLPSGNDAARALAEHVGPSIPRFVNEMNAEARHLRLRCSHFSSPDGYADLGNTSCAPDLALLARQILRHPRLARIVRTGSIEFRFPIKGHKLFLANNNPLLRDGYPGTTGVKTGFTDAAGRCLVATARRGRIALGVVLLHSPDPGGQAERLLNRGFAAVRGPRRAHRAVHARRVVRAGA